jgi:hypothetical protein
MSAVGTYQAVKRMELRTRQRRLFTLAPMFGLLLGCGAEGQPLGDRPEPVATADEFDATARTGTSADAGAAEVSETSAVAEEIARVPFDFPEIGIRGMIPDGFKMTLGPRTIQTPLDGVTIGVVNWVGAVEVGAITISVARGLEVTNENSPELRPDVQRIEGSGKIEGLSQFVDELGATEILWRLDDTTVVTVVGNGFKDSVALVSIAESMVVTLPAKGLDQ